MSSLKETKKDKKPKRSITVVIEQPEMERETSNISSSTGRLSQKSAARRSAQKKGGIPNDLKELVSVPERCSSAPPRIQPLKYFPELFKNGVKKKVKKTKSEKPKKKVKPFPRTKPVKVIPSELQEPVKVKQTRRKTLRNLKPFGFQKVAQARDVKQYGNSDETQKVIEKLKTKKRKGSMIPTQIEKLQETKENTEVDKEVKGANGNKDDESLSNERDEYTRQLSPDTVKRLSDKYFRSLYNGETEEQEKTIENVEEIEKVEEDPEVKGNVEEVPWSTKIWRLFVDAMSLPIPTDEAIPYMRSRSAPGKRRKPQKEDKEIDFPPPPRRARSLPAITIIQLPVSCAKEQEQKQKKERKLSKEIQRHVL